MYEIHSPISSILYLLVPHSFNSHYKLFSVHVELLKVENASMLVSLYCVDGWQMMCCSPHGIARHSNTLVKLIQEYMKATFKGYCE